MEQGAAEWKRVRRLRALKAAFHAALAVELPVTLVEEFDCASDLLMERLVTMPREPDGSIWTTTRQLEEVLRMGRKRVDKRLKALARFQWLMVTTTVRAGGDGVRRPATCIQLAPAVLAIVDKRDDARGRREVIAQMMKIGLHRHDRGQDWQGFTSHVPYGEPDRVLPESTPAAELPPGDELFREAKVVAEAQEAAEAKRAAAAERQAHRVLGARWVEACGRAWLHMQQKRGRMKATASWPEAAPNWALVKGGVASGEARELVRVLDQLGGARAAAAWCYFVAAKDSIDPATGKSIHGFDKSLSFMLHVTDDRKPSHFVKHLNALLVHPYFEEFCGGEHIKRLLAYFADDLVALAPRPLAVVMRAVGDARRSASADAATATSKTSIKPPVVQSVGGHWADEPQGGVQ